MVKIRQLIVPKHLASKVTSSTKSAVTSITVHETDNTSPRANADAHARLQYNGNRRQASWHYQVDDKEIVQSFSDDTKCWAGGDGVNGASQNSIHIEICVNSDGNFAKAKANAQALIAHLMAKHNLPLSKVYQHNHWSGKNCPRNIRKEGWSKFLAGVGSTSNVKPAPSKPNVSNTGSVKKGDKVKVKSSATKYANVNKAIPNWVKGKTYTVTSVDSSKALLSDINSWVSLTDLEVSKGSTVAPKPSTGGKLTVNPAKGYLKKGDRGSDVRTLQQMLSNVYFYPNKALANKGVDGIFGKDTENAVRRFQSVHLPHEVDGIAGRRTIAKLTSLQK